MQNEYEALLQDFFKNKAITDYYETKALPQSEQILNQSGKSYSTGDISYVEYIQNLDKAIEIRTNYLQSLLEYNFAIIAINEITGKIN